MDERCVTTDNLDTPMFPMPKMVCRSCYNSLGPPWHSPKGFCYFGDGPLWRRILRKLKKGGT